MSRLELKHIRQPKGSNLCGQACVAMAANVSIGQAILAIGKSGKTRWCDLRRGLKKLGVQFGGVRRGPPPEYAGLFIAIVQWPGTKFRHYVIRFHSVWFDPDSDVISFKARPERWGEFARVVSHLPVHV